MVPLLFDVIKKGCRHVKVLQKNVVPGEVVVEGNIVRSDLEACFIVGDGFFIVSRQ